MNSCEAQPRYGVASGDCAARLQRCLDVVEQRNTDLRALITVDADNAMQSAVKLDATGHVDPPAGIVVTIKDNIDTADLRTTMGSRFFAANVPAVDAEVSRRLRAARCIILGKANLHEFAFGGTSQNPHYGNCRNPWDRQRIPGGSSGGSGAAVAVGMCEGSLGTDTGGSVRIPAALNGVVGLRPSPGRISNRGMMPSSPRFDVIGPLAHTAETVALLYQVVAGYDPADPDSVDRPVEAVPQLRDAPLRGARIALPEEGFLDDADPEVQLAIRQGMDVLCQFGAAASLHPVQHVRRTHDAMACVVRADAADFQRERLLKNPELFGADVLARLKLGLETSRDDYRAGLAIGEEWRVQVDNLFQHVDYIVTPTVGFAAPLIGRPDEMIARTDALTRMTFVWSFAGTPAISIPCGFTQDGLPIGMQVIGRPWSDASLLAIACAYQTVTTHHLRRPPEVSTLSERSFT